MYTPCINLNTTTKTGALDGTVSLSAPMKKLLNDIQQIQDNPIVSSVTTYDEREVTMLGLKGYTKSLASDTYIKRKNDY